MAGWTGYDERYYGDPIHDRAYNAESLFVSLAWLPQEEKTLRKQILANLRTHIVDWAVRNHGIVWHKEGKPSHDKDPLLLTVLRLYQQRVRNSPTLAAVVKKAFHEEDRNTARALRLFKKSGSSGEAIAIYGKPEWLFRHITLPKFYSTNGLTGMALVAQEKPGALFPHAGPRS
jgi:hypothetical protein